MNLTQHIFTLALLLLLGLIANDCAAQQPIPSSPSGFSYRPDVGSSSKKVVLEVFIDLLCPDSKKAQLALKGLIDTYDAHEFELVYHLFPLPYHRNAYPVAQATMTLTDGNPAAFLPWLTAMYANQEHFWNKASQNDGQVAVTKQLESLARKVFPNFNQANWDRQMTGHGGTEMDSATRTVWKYACSRGVTGTPIYFVNNVPVSSAGASWTLSQWKDLLQPLINANQKKVQPTSVFSANKVYVVPRPYFALTEAQANANRCGTQTSGGENLSACEFSPNQSMCCLPSEFCIPNRGCV